MEPEPKPGPESKRPDEASSSNMTWHSGIMGQSSWQRRQSDLEQRRRYPLFHVGELAMAELLDDKESMEKKVLVGICAMAKKSNSKPMKEIIRRLDNFTRLQVIIFPENVILNSPVEDWPVVNALISFFSTGFPLDKAIAYKNLRQPFVVNDLDMQQILQDRTEVYRILEEQNIPHPRYAVLNRQKDPGCRVVETEDSIEINGQMHLKPFVEKPIDAEDHNVYIYFPQSAGGGSTRLFRKVKDRSSVYSHTSRVRRNGAYLYEDFMPTDGTDVKVYTVGTDYQHAEARKSPCLDGKVERDQDGKEIRYPVLLSASEKLIARKVVWAFGQNVCGFDLLRANGKCYVCDVNGFSFVKTSSKYYDDCARILGTLMLREVCPTLHIPYPLGPAPEDLPVVPTTSGPMMELRCVVALIRHGDRTPKQKMKMEVKNKLFFNLFEKYGGFKTSQLKLKRPKQLQEVLDIVRQLLTEGNVSADPDLQDKKAKLQQMKLVLEMYGHFSGINRKVQLKYQPHGRPKHSSSEEDDAPRDPSLLLILKWGGELTPAGRIQAESLGKAFRTLYPGGQGQFEAPGLGFLRLHSTFRHDLKIYASDEGRVQMTAAAFTKGLLALEGELTPILVQMVKSANTNGLLDGEGKTSMSQLVVKEKLKCVFNQDHDFSEEDNFKLNPTNTIALTNAMDFVKNPQEMCQRVFEMISEITAKIRSLKAELKSRELPLYNGESWELLIRRWAKLEKDFQLKNGLFEISKIPDIYDCIKYDLHHNQKTLNYERAQELFMCSKALADIIIPQEYGITVDEKLHIAQNYCTPFLRKIRCDFLQVINPNWEDETTRLDSRYSKGVSSPERFVRTRLYFTSESHIHSMLNILRYGCLFENGADLQWDRALSFLDATAELNYMSQIVFMLFEDPSKDLNSDDRYHMELHFSPGAYTSCDEPTEPRGMGYRPRGKDTPTLEDSVDPERLPEHLVSAFHAPLSGTSGKHGLRLDTAAAAAMELGDINEADMFEMSSTPEASPNLPKAFTLDKSKESPKQVAKLPGSPDPNIPDWDWGDDPSHNTATSRVPSSSVDTLEGTGQQLQDIVSAPAPVGPVDEADKTITSMPTVHSVGATLDSSPFVTSGSPNPQQPPAEVSIPALPEPSVTRLVSQPITIAITSCSSPDTQKLSLEEKRSRSLEDKSDQGSPENNLYSTSFPTPVSSQSSSLPSTFHRNYKTVHLPLHTDISMRRSLPSVFTLGFGFGVTRALEGFSFVPQLHPLETLHNTLTFREIDDFLGRVTSERFPMPAISPTLMANRPSLMLVSPSKILSTSYPPSSNSSSGPSSPNSVPIPIDFLNNLRMYINENEAQKSEESDTSIQKNKDEGGLGNSNASSWLPDGDYQPEGDKTIQWQSLTDKAPHHIHTTDCDAAAILYHPDQQADSSDTLQAFSLSSLPTPPSCLSSQVQFAGLDDDCPWEEMVTKGDLQADCSRKAGQASTGDEVAARGDLQAAELCNLQAHCSRKGEQVSTKTLEAMCLTASCMVEDKPISGEAIPGKSSSDPGLSQSRPASSLARAGSNRFAVSRISDDAHKITRSLSREGEEQS